MMNAWRFSMKGSETKLVAYMQGSNKRFVIPVYQRNYDWKTENCKQLYDDLVKVVREGKKSHFFGSIVSVFNPDGAHDDFFVIDGQQRLTTVSLLFLAMYNLIRRSSVVAVSNNLSQRIYEEYLVDKWQDDEARIKLKPVKNDRTAFGRFFGDESEFIRESNLTVNYNYFQDRIQKEEVKIDELFDAICRLEIISITLNNDDNPQLIFESLNSTGVALSEGDKIRNFILMGLPNSRQTVSYEKYWNPIEICTEYDVSSFIRDYLSIKQQATPSLNRIYITFKAYVEDNAIETQELLESLLFYAKLYETLLQRKTPNRQLNACIYRLDRLETTVTRPFFLEVLRLWREDKLTIKEVSDVFLTTESYLFRRVICDMPSNALNKIFLLLHREIIRLDGTEANYVEKFRYVLLNKKERTRFPDDTEFADSFGTRQIYLMNSKNKIYILERFENYDTLEDKDIYRHFDDGEYSIEHIMPQHLTPAWIKSLGSDYEQIHELWLHRIANLTLTAYNSRYSNSSFQEKKDIKYGFRESGIRINQYIAQQDNWGLPELGKRSQHLMSRALDIWPTPETEYKPEIKLLDSCTLDEDVSLSGRIIARFSYKGMEHPVESWAQMYDRVIGILHAEDKSVLTRLAFSRDPNMDLAQYVSDRRSSLRVGSEIDESIFIERNISTSMKINLLRRFFRLYGADPTDLVFYLRDSKDDPDIGPRSELRKRYWAFALNHIRKALEGTGTFSRVNPSSDNWINGYFGVNSCNISCVANNDQARVEVMLAKASKEANKAIFDSLFSKKAEIEQSLSKPLEWVRGDDMKVSVIYCSLPNVSIANETDWLMMARFHAEWSRKLYDVFVPLIREAVLR